MRRPVRVLEMIEHTQQGVVCHPAAQAPIRFREQMRVREMQNPNRIGDRLNRVSLRSRNFQ
jgi:hypothetical protein